MEQIFFLYDKLMLESEQKIVGIKAKFLTFAQTRAKLYWFDDDKRRRVFTIEQNATRTSRVFGALYAIDYEIYKYRLHSYYYNMQPFINTDCEYDYFTPITVEAVPLRFNSLSQLQNNKTIKGETINALMFAGNKRNKIIEYNSARKYYKLHGIDTDSFLKLTKEQQKKHEEKEKKK